MAAVKNASLESAHRPAVAAGPGGRRGVRQDPRGHPMQLGLRTAPSRPLGDQRGVVAGGVHRRGGRGVQRADPAPRRPPPGWGPPGPRRRMRRRPDRPAGRRGRRCGARRGRGPDRGPDHRGGPAGRRRAPGPRWRGRLAVRHGLVRRGGRLPGLRAHRRASTRPSPRWAGCWPRAAGSCSSSTTRCCRRPSSGLDRRHHPRRAVLAHRALPGRGLHRSRRWTRTCGSPSSTGRCPATSTP